MKTHKLLVILCMMSVTISIQATVADNEIVYRQI
jgi:hypothetical protein